MEIKLCRDCQFFKPNAGVVSDAIEVDPKWEPRQKK